MTHRDMVYLIFNWLVMCFKAFLKRKDLRFRSRVEMSRTGTLAFKVVKCGDQNDKRARGPG